MQIQLHCNFHGYSSQGWLLVYPKGLFIGAEMGDRIWGARLKVGNTLDTTNWKVPRLLYPPVGGTFQRKKDSDAASTGLSTPRNFLIAMRAGKQRGVQFWHEI